MTDKTKLLTTLYLNLHRVRNTTNSFLRQLVGTKFMKLVGQINHIRKDPNKYKTLLKYPDGNYLEISKHKSNKHTVTIVIINGYEPPQKVTVDLTLNNSDYH